MSHSAPLRRPARLGVLSCSLTGAIVLAILFLLAWATSAVANVPASNAFLAFFTQQAMRAPHGEFASSLVSALGLGALVGGLVAVCFNLVTGALRR
jgi:hypothetical protein